MKRFLDTLLGIFIVLVILCLTATICLGMLSLFLESLLLVIITKVFAIVSAFLVIIGTTISIFLD